MTNICWPLISKKSGLKRYITASPTVAPSAGVEPASTSVEQRCPIHWTTRAVIPFTTGVGERRSADERSRRDNKNTHVLRGVTEARRR